MLLLAFVHYKLVLIFSVTLADAYQHKLELAQPAVRNTKCIYVCMYVCYVCMYV